MPVTICFIKDKHIPDDQLQTMADDWAHLIGVDKKDTCINIVNIAYQLGHQYTLLANLYLPSIWNANDIKRIQLALLQVLSRYFMLAENEIIIMTFIIQPEHVVENGQIIKW